MESAMLRKWLVLLLITYISIACNQNKVKEINYYPDKTKLALIDSLIFTNSEDLFIGSINDIEIIQGSICIFDKSFSKIHIFDNKFKYIDSIGKYGNGPGEFVTAPFLSENDNKIVAFDRKNLKLLLYEKNIIADEIHLPKHFFYQTSNSIFLNDKILLSATNKLIRDLKSINGYTTVLMLNKDGKFYRNIGELSSKYSDHKEKLFYARNSFSLISEGPDESFYILQGATYEYQKVDKDGNVINSYKYKPRFFKEPPDIKIDQEPNDLRKAYETYYTKITYYAKLIFDKESKILYVNYRSLNMNHYYSRSFLDAENYLLAIDNIGRCIFDEKISGYLADIDSGKIFIMEEENPSRLVINKYVLKVNNE
jgi:hypothetical protein